MKGWKDDFSFSNGCFSGSIFIFGEVLGGVSPRKTSHKAFGRVPWSKVMGEYVVFFSRIHGSMSFTTVSPVHEYVDVPDTLNNHSF